MYKEIPNKIEQNVPIKYQDSNYYIAEQQLNYDPKDYAYKNGANDNFQEGSYVTKDQIAYSSNQNLQQYDDHYADYPNLYKNDIGSQQNITQVDTNQYYKDSDNNYYLLKEFSDMQIDVKDQDESSLVKNERNLNEMYYINKEEQTDLYINRYNSDNNELNNMKNYSETYKYFNNNNFARQDRKDLHYQNENLMIDPLYEGLEINDSYYMSENFFETSCEDLQKAQMSQNNYDSKITNYDMYSNNQATYNKEKNLKIPDNNVRPSSFTSIHQFKGDIVENKKLNQIKYQTHNTEKKVSQYYFQK